MNDHAQPWFPEDQRRQRLLVNKLGDLLSWKKPELTSSIGPTDLGVFDQFDLQRRELISTCVEKLISITDDEIGSMIDGGNSTSDAQAWRKFLLDDVEALRRRTPPWHAGGFGHPDHRADFSYWTKMPKFDLGELTCLSVGISPTEFSWEQLFKMTKSRERAQFRPAVDFLVKRFEQLLRKFGLHGPDSSVRPADFIEWATQFEFEVDPGFWEPLKRFHVPKKAPEVAAGRAVKPDKREVDSIAQLFTAMAIEQFGYDPRQARSPITKEIGDLAAGMGMSISDDTILKYLRIGASFIPETWSPGKR